jgi:imidazolonepropionase-like amidohydrolase
MALVLRNASLLDVEQRIVVPQTSVRVEGGSIAAVGPRESVLAAPEDEVVDCDGRFLLPGLMDMHVHLRAEAHRGPTSAEPVPATASESDRADKYRALESRLHSYLYCGVTSLYDAGNDEDIILPLREDERAGKLLSPRIFCAGAFVTCTGGHGSQFGRAVEIDALPGDVDALREHISHGPDIVKITYDEHNWGIRPLIPILNREVLAGIIAFVHESMLRVTVHVSNELRAREAIACGADTLAHPVIQSPVTAEWLWLLAARRIPVVSTLAIGERYFRLADDPSFLDERLYAACIEPEERERLRTEEHRTQLANRWADWMRVMTPVAQENLRGLVEAGGVVVTGTDLSLGAELRREMQLLQSAGLTPWEVLRCATLNGAAFLGKEREMGSVAVGKVADIVLVDEDPTLDVSHLDTVSMVVKGGHVVDRSLLKLPCNVSGTAG